MAEVMRLAALLVLLTTVAVAEPLPVAKSGQCPASYRESGGYCVPTSGAPAAIPKLGVCPSGWASEASYCVQVPSPTRARPLVGRW